MSHRFTFPVPTDHAPGGWHAAYMDVYEKLFAPMKDHEGLALLEIGTDGGGGLCSYRKYFHEDAMIVGVDISPAPESLNSRDIRHHQEDAYTHDFLALLLGKYGHFEILIDDGPHTLGSQQFFVQHYPSVLTRDGLLIVEDIQDPAHVPELQRLLPAGMVSMGVDLRANNGRYDDMLLVAWWK